MRTVTRVARETAKWYSSPDITVGALTIDRPASSFLLAAAPSLSPSTTHQTLPMAHFLVEGGHPLNGSIRPAGNKNAALPALAATLLASKPVTLENVPRINDVEALAEILRALGAVVSWEGPNVVTVDAGQVAEVRPPAPSPSASGPPFCWPGRCSRGSGASCSHLLGAT